MKVVQYIVYLYFHGMLGVLGGSIRECSLLESVCPTMFSSEFVVALCAVYLETMVVTDFCPIVIVEIDYHSEFPVRACTMHSPRGAVSQL
jgi:hypothetical protein